MPDLPSFQPDDRVPAPPRTDPLLADRHRALHRLRRRRLGLWWTLGRSNRLFPRKLVVTREGKWIIAVALLLGAGAVNTGNNLLYLVLSLVISVISVSGILSELCLRDIVVRRRYPAEVTVGEPAPLRLDVHNDKSRPALHLEVGEVIDDDGDVQVRSGYVLHLGPGEQTQTYAMVRALRRGPVATVGLQVVTAHPFGFARKSRLYDAPAHFLSLPRVTPVQLPYRGANQRGSHESARRAGHGESFHGLRDARPGDPLRDIHWKVSARRDRLIVREWEAEASRVALVRFVHVFPHLDRPAGRTPGAVLPPASGAEPDVRAIDAACATVAGLCEALLLSGFAVGLQTLQGAVAPQADPGQSGEVLLRLRRHLAWLTPADRRPPPDWPLPDGEWAEACRRADQVAQSIARGEALAWAPMGALPPAEVFLVTFASRTDVRVPGAAQVSVTLEPSGELRGFAEADRLQGAA